MDGVKRWLEQDTYLRARLACTAPSEAEQDAASHPHCLGAPLRAVPVMCVTRDALRLRGHPQPQPPRPLAPALFPGASLAADASCC